uniref:DUF4220 domain-containing protein n=1 Tax=Setaria italica TaxID=4555 RepID=K3ZM96_SETIT
WTALLCICKYVNGSKFLCPWGNRICCRRHPNPCLVATGQCIFVQSFNYSPWKWKLMHKLTLGVVASKGDDTKLSDAIRIPKMVKAKVFEALCLCGLRSKNFEGHYLPKDFTSLCASGQQENKDWSECLQLPTCSQVILAWHIATSLCEMKLAQDCGMDLSKQEFLVDEKSLDGDLTTNYKIANSFSRPDLLPDTILVPKVILQNTVSHAREMLKDCDSLQSIYKKLIEVARGAILGKKLMEDEYHWELLAKVWVDLLVHIAPSSNAEAHAKHLESGGEFVTLIWALFCHCGIEKSELWQENATSRNSSPGSSQQNNGVAPTTQVQQQTAPPAAQPDGSNIAK